MLRVGLLSAAHVHASSYLKCLIESPAAACAGLWDDDRVRGNALAERYGVRQFEARADLLSSCDAVVVASENLSHAEHVGAAVSAGIAVLCEKPLAASQSEWDAIAGLGDGPVIATAFPCPFSPTFNRLVSIVRSGEIGRIIAISSTNRGQCPFGWFVDLAASGGGAMIDHTVHVADLLRRLLGAEPLAVYAQVGANVHGGAVEDTAMLTLDFPGGVFATLDASWSRPATYKTWGDVTLRVTGERGVIEADLFGQGTTVWREGCRHVSTTSDLDALMVADFLAAVSAGTEPMSGRAAGLAASRVALCAYQSLGERGPISLG